MASLPNISNIKPKTKITLSNGDEVFLTPLKIKHEKAVLFSTPTSGEPDPKLLLNIYNDIIRDCSSCNPELLSVSDYQWIIFNLRKISSGAKFTANLFCNACESYFDSMIDLDKLSIEPFKDVNIEITDDVSMILEQEKMSNAFIDMQYPEKIIPCIKKIINGGESFDVDQFEKKDLEEFVLNLDTDVSKQIKDKKVFDSKIKFEQKVKCKHCKVEHDIEPTEILSFF